MIHKGVKLSLTRDCVMNMKVPAPWICELHHRPTYEGGCIPFLLFFKLFIYPESPLAHASFRCPSSVTSRFAVRR